LRIFGCLNEPEEDRKRQSSIAFTIMPSPVLLKSLAEDKVEAWTPEGVAAFLLGFGPSIVCVLNEVFVALIAVFKSKESLKLFHYNFFV
jgi:hypothetical protein